MSTESITKAEQVALEGKVMALVLQRVPQYKIAQELGVTRYMIGKICNSESFLSTLKSQGDRAVALVREQFKSRLDELSPLAYEALKHNLKENKIEAVRIFAEMIGIKERKEEEQKDTQLTVVLPGAKLEGVIPATATTYTQEISDAETDES